MRETVISLSVSSFIFWSGITALVFGYPHITFSNWLIAFGIACVAVAICATGKKRVI